MKKDIWEKLSVTGTLFNTIVLALITIFINYKLNVISKNIEENNMIKSLVTDLISDTSNDIKADLALLSLERYLMKSNDGKLKVYDKKMLMGFSESIILERVNNKKNIDDLSNLKIPQEIMFSIDSNRFNQFFSKIVEKTIAKQAIDSSSGSQKNAPLYQVDSTINSDAISALADKIVFIQYNNKNDKNKPLEIQAKFKGNNWKAPGIEFVKGNYKSSIRYFHKEDLQTASNAQKVLEGCSFNIDKLTFIGGFEKRVPKNQIEVWLAN